MNLIVAADKNWAIGKDGNLLCRLPNDLKYFKERTTGKTVVMGRKTLESLPGGKPLPNRKNLILTSDKSFSKEGCTVVNSIEELLEKYNDENLMVIGGGMVYTELLPYCDSCYITKIDGEFEADTHIPNLDKDNNFEVVWESENQEENGINYRFTQYKRINNG